jgi:hypothetical protein
LPHALIRPTDRFATEQRPARNSFRAFIVKSPVETQKGPESNSRQTI